MYCTNCGKELADGERFCTACGTPAVSTDSAPSSVGNRPATSGDAVQGDEPAPASKGEDHPADADEAVAAALSESRPEGAGALSADDADALPGDASEAEPPQDVAEGIDRADQTLEDADGGRDGSASGTQELADAVPVADQSTPAPVVDLDDPTSAVEPAEPMPDSAPEASASTTPPARSETPTAPTRKRYHVRNALIAAAAVLILAVVGILVVGGRSEDSSTRTVLDLEDVEDEGFRGYLAELADTDGDGVITESEASQVKEMGTYEDGKASGGPSGLNITSLKGIENFENIKTLVCTDNDIDEIDLGSNPALETIVCTGNGVKELKLPHGDSLATLHATGNEMESIDLSQSGGLTDVQLDEGVEIKGGELPSKEAQAHISDMTLVFGTAQVSFANTEVTADLVSAAGASVAADSRLIYSMVYPSNIRTPRIQRGQVNYGFSYKADGLDFEVPLETGAAVLDSFYGSHPDDLSYIDDGLLTYTGSGWTMRQADGPYSRTIATDNWFSYGKLVAFDADIDYMDGEADASTYSYRVVVAEDEDSAFGYHMVSMLLRDFDGRHTEVGEDTATADDASDSAGANTGARADTSSKPSSKSNTSNTVGYDFDLKNILGKHTAEFKSTTGWYGGDHNCYAGRVAPLTIDVKSLDEDRMTITYDVTMVLHGHYDPDNVQDAMEGDVTVTLTDVQSRIKIGKIREKAYFSNKDSMVTDTVTPRIYFTLYKTGEWNIQVDSIYFPTQNSAGFGVADNYVIDLA